MDMERVVSKMAARSAAIPLATSELSMRKLVINFRCSLCIRIGFANEADAKNRWCKG